MEISRHFDQTIRDRIFILEWNGENFVISERYSAPKFRFQVIQDADSFVNNGDFPKAFSSYQEAIFSDTVDWWSFSRYKQQFQASYWGSEATPITIIPNPAEYPSLAAYAYYRIMLLHLVQGQEAEAASTYQTLQDTFGSNQYAASLRGDGNCLLGSVSVHAQDVRWLCCGNPIRGRAPGDSDSTRE